MTYFVPEKNTAHRLARELKKTMLLCCLHAFLCQLNLSCLFFSCIIDSSLAALWPNRESDEAPLQYSTKWNEQVDNISKSVKRMRLTFSAAVVFNSVVSRLQSTHQSRCPLLGFMTDAPATRLECWNVVTIRMSLSVWIETKTFAFISLILFCLIVLASDENENSPMPSATDLRTSSAWSVKCQSFGVIQPVANSHVSFDFQNIFIHFNLICFQLIYWFYDEKTHYPSNSLWFLRLFFNRFDCSRPFTFTAGKRKEESSRLGSLSLSFFSTRFELPFLSSEVATRGLSHSNLKTIVSGLQLLNSDRQSPKLLTPLRSLR